MAIPLPERFTQICARFNANQPTVKLYSPSKITLLGTDCWYQGNGIILNFMASIRLISPARVPFLDPLWTSKERQDAIEEFRSNQRIGLLIYLQQEFTFTGYEIGMIELYNNIPYYLEKTDILREFCVQPGWELWASTYDLGWGTLAGNDYISCTGYARETGAFLQDSDNNIIPTINRVG